MCVRFLCVRSCSADFHPVCELLYTCLQSPIPTHATHATHALPTHHLRLTERKEKTHHQKRSQRNRKKNIVLCDASRRFKPHPPPPRLRPQDKKNDCAQKKTTTPARRQQYVTNPPPPRYPNTVIPLNFLPPPHTHPHPPPAPHPPPPHALFLSVFVARLPDALVLFRTFPPSPHPPLPYSLLLPTPLSLIHRTHNNKKKPKANKKRQGATPLRGGSRSHPFHPPPLPLTPSPPHFLCHVPSTLLRQFGEVLLQWALLRHAPPLNFLPPPPLPVSSLVLS